MCCVYIHVPTQSSITPKRSTPVNPIPLLYLNMRAPLSSLSAVLSTCVCVSQERMRRHQASIISVDMGPLGNSHRTEPAVVATRPFMTTPWSHEGSTIGHRYKMPVSCRLNTGFISNHAGLLSALQMVTFHQGMPIQLMERRSWKALLLTATTLTHFTSNFMYDKAFVVGAHLVIVLYD